MRHDDPPRLVLYRNYLGNVPQGIELPVVPPLFLLRLLLLLEFQFASCLVQDLVEGRLLLRLDLFL